MYVHIRIILHKYRVLAKISKKKLINFIRLVEANIRQNIRRLVSSVKFLLIALVVWCSGQSRCT
jgi:hypothetical protein